VVALDDETMSLDLVPRVAEVNAQQFPHAFIVVDYQD